jgi:hypothetical protein
MFTVTIEVADADELLRLATCIQAGFCEVQGRNIVSALTPKEIALAHPAAEAAPAPDQPRKRVRRKNRDADTPPDMVPDAGEPVPDDVSIETATKAVREAIQKFGLPAVRSVLIDLGLKDVLSASPAERGDLLAALRKLQ